MSEDAPVRIGVVTQVLGGGTGMQIRGVYGHALLDDWEREVVVLGPGAEPAPRGARLTRLPAIAELGRYPIGQTRALLRLRRHVRKTRPHVLHTYFFWPILFGRALKALGEINFLVENREDEGFNWGAHEYALLRLTRRLPNRVICVSESVRRHVLDQEGLAAERVAVVHNGVPVPRRIESAEIADVRDDLGLDAGRPVVGMVANMNRRVKGIRYFFDAAVRIRAEQPETRFLLVGGGRDLEHHRQRAEGLGLAEAVCFAGFREDVAPLYELMDVSVLTSVSEGLSITLLESMRRGVPVVVTRVGGNPEVVIDGKTGYLVPPMDADALAERVLYLLENPEERERMARRARKRAERDFSIDRTALGYAEVLRSMATVDRPPVTT